MCSRRIRTPPVKGLICDSAQPLRVGLDELDPICDPLLHGGITGQRHVPGTIIHTCYLAANTRARCSAEVPRPAAKSSTLVWASRPSRTPRRSVSASPPGWSDSPSSRRTQSLAYRSAQHAFVVQVVLYVKQSSDR